MGAEEERLTLVSGTEGGGAKAPQDLEVGWTWRMKAGAQLTYWLTWVTTGWLPSGERECRVGQAEVACDHPDTQQVEV